MATRRRLLAAGIAWALGVAAGGCSQADPAGRGGAGSPAAATSGGTTGAGTNATGQGPATSGGASLPSATGAGATTGGATAGPTPPGLSIPGPPGGGGAGRPPGAAPGQYGVAYSASSNVPGSSRSGTATLTISAARPAAGGAASQDATVASGQASLTLATVFQPSGEADLTSVSSSGPACGQPLTLTFSPPLIFVPSPLATGQRRSGSFSGGGFSGHWSSSVGDPGTDSVGGVAVAVWHVDVSIDHLAGSYCGQSITGTIVDQIDWAPSLDLFAVLQQSTDVRTASGLHVTSRATDTLQSTHPS